MAALEEPLVEGMVEGPFRNSPESNLEPFFGL
jgi:hypothetical protein